MNNKFNQFAEWIQSKPISQIRNSPLYLGEGSARIVLKYSKTRCIKLAKNIKGEIQNSQELDVSDSFTNMKIPTKFLAKVFNSFYVDKKSMYPKAILCEYLPERVYNSKQIKGRGLRKLLENLENYFEFSVYGDLERPSSYRKKGNTIKLVDYGLSKATYKKIIFELKGE